MRIVISKTADELGMRAAEASAKIINEAIAKNGAINAFLRQGLDERPQYDETIRRLKEAVS